MRHDRLAEPVVCLVGQNCRPPIVATNASRDPAVAQAPNPLNTGGAGAARASDTDAAAKTTETNASFRLRARCFLPCTRRASHRTGARASGAATIPSTENYELRSTTPPSFRAQQPYFQKVISRRQSSVAVNFVAELVSSDGGCCSGSADGDRPVLADCDALRFDDELERERLSLG